MMMQFCRWSCELVIVLEVLLLEHKFGKSMHAAESEEGYEVIVADRDAAVMMMDC